MGFTKIIFIAALAVAGYMVWRRVQGALAGQKDKVSRREAGRVLSDMEKCPTCGTYVAAGMGRCNRADCPR